MLDTVETMKDSVVSCVEKISLAVKRNKAYTPHTSRE